MKILLDSHVLLWWLGDDGRLDGAAHRVISEEADEVVVSAASVWEIGIKRALGKLTAPDDLPEQVETSGFTAWSMTVDDARAAANLPRHHGDPFDRMLVAQARERGATLMSADRVMTGYDVELYRL